MGQTAMTKLVGPILLITATCAVGTVAIGGCVVLDAALTVRCVDHKTESKQLTTPNDDTATQFKIDRCSLDSEACTDLCNFILEEAAISETLTGCDVHFNGTSSVTIDAHYDQQTNNSGCSQSNISSPGGDDFGGGTTGVADAGSVEPTPPTQIIDAPTAFEDAR
jgi:hypothetical protein